MTDYFPPAAVRAFVANLWSAFVAAGAVFCTALAATTATDGVNWVVVGGTTGAAFFGVLASSTERAARAARAGLEADVLDPTERDIITRYRDGSLLYEPPAQSD